MHLGGDMDVIMALNDLRAQVIERDNQIRLLEFAGRQLITAFYKEDVIELSDLNEELLDAICGLREVLKM